MFSGRLEMGLNKVALWTWHKYTVRLRTNSCAIRPDAAAFLNPVSGPGDGLDIWTEADRVQLSAPSGPTRVVVSCSDPPLAANPPRCFTLRHAASLWNWPQSWPQTGLTRRLDPPDYFSSHFSANFFFISTNWAGEFLRLLWFVVIVWQEKSK